MVVSKVNSVLVDPIAKINTVALLTVSDVAAEASVALFQEFAGIGDCTEPEHLNNNDTAQTATLQINQYAIVVYGDLVKIKRWRQYGNTWNDGGGQVKIQYWNVITNAWVDWVTGIVARETADWSNLATESEVVTTKIKLIATLVTDKAPKLGELEVIF